MASIPAVKALEATYRARGLRVVSVTESDPTDSDEVAAVARAVKEHGMDYPCLLDEDSAWMSRVGIPAVPAFLVIDAQGVVKSLYRGKLTEGSEGYAALAGVIEASLR